MNLTMNESPVNSDRDAPSFNTIELLKQASASEANGYIRILANSVEWRIYLNRGKLIYATHSLDPFDRLERHLRRLSQKNTTLTSSVRSQARLNFDGETQEESYLPPDYHAIWWLFKKQYLKEEELAFLVKKINLEVLESYLLLKTANCEFIANQADYSQFPTWELQKVIEECRQQLKAWQALTPLVESPEQRPYFFSQAQAQQMLSPDQQEKLSKLLRGFSFRQLAVLTNQDEIKIAQRFYPLIKNKTIVLRNPQSPFDKLPTIPAFVAFNSGVNAIEQPAQIEESPSETLKNLPNEAVSQKQYKIFCVDDSPTILKEIDRFLGDHNLQIHAITNSAKALIEIVRIKPDMILLDVGMPQIDGYQLCRLVRNHPLFKETPIIMVTGNTGLIDRAKARVAGATDYLTKPFTQAELVKMVFRYLT
jgi:two-component system, chemotaxis family, response regulator PixG